MPIENTQHPDSIHATGLLAVAAAMGGADPSEVIEGQEKAGQAQLVHSDQLPTDMSGDEQGAFEALGFTFGDPDERDPLFRPATLPESWKREASDHSMWSYIVDELGRRRVRIFYKAAFYDRRAFMSLTTVTGYITDCQHRNVDVITDSTWATPAVVAEAARERAEAAQTNADRWADAAYPDAAQWKAEAEAERDAYLAIAAKHTTT
ncbi:hypothetical protein [Streptomyces viridosporus]|uniref:hypothetical protein n=1 Tax=Streptomyces viridosporus TaxID=67581 RepID=UPI0036F67548